MWDFPIATSIWLNVVIVENRDDLG
jgi:hypothetical protein